MSLPVDIASTGGRVKLPRECGMTKLIRFFNDEFGATAIEYGLIAAATGLALAAAMPAIETGLGTVFGSVSAELK